MEAFISLSPESTYSTGNILRLPVSMRDCLFENERKLSVFQRYSYTNCLAECRSEMIFKLCGCVPYHLPYNGTLPICQMDKIECVLNNKNVYSGALPGLNNTINQTWATLTIADSPCDCLPDCQLQQYPAEITSAFLNRTYALNTLTFL